MKEKAGKTRQRICFFCIFTMVAGLLMPCPAAFADASSFFKKATDLIDTVAGQKTEKNDSGNTSKTSSGKAAEKTSSSSTKTKAQSGTSSKSTETQAVHVILQNNGSSPVTVELIDQYGGNFSAEIDSGMSQNHTLKNNSSVKVNGASIHVISTQDDGKTVVVAQ